jgi:3-deoxy-manno-octulosonate cytidylyltransferase (CMP-KDO synthetase)
LPDTLPDSGPASGPDIIIIPARFGSTRLPGKPLLPIAGRTLLDRVVAIARTAAAQAGDCEVVVATDDERIAAHGRELGVDVAMTPPISIPAPSAPLRRRPRAAPPAFVVNLQGDAPFTPPRSWPGCWTSCASGRPRS